MPRPIVAYVSGHGYGHLTRSLEVLLPLAAHTEVHLRTSDRALRLARERCAFASLAEVDLGPGVVQRGPLAVDVAATRGALNDHLTRFPTLVAREARWLREVGAGLVFADVPPLAFAAAAAAGVPSLGLSNFSWSFIYRAYEERDPWFADAARRLADAEAQCTLFLELAMGAGLAHFPRRRPIAPVARRPTRGRAAIRADLGLDEGDPRPVVVVSFGGFGGELDLRTAAAANPDLRLLVVGAAVEGVGDRLRAVIPDERCPHQDLTLAADCLLGKVGYSTVAECLAGPTPLVHVPRGEFAEEAPLVAGLARWLPQAPLAAADLFAGRWSEAVGAAITSRPPEPAPAPTGAAAAVAAALTLLERPQP